MSNALALVENVEVIEGEVIRAGEVIALPPFRVPGPGLYDLPAPAYHADPCPEPSLSHSIARLLVGNKAKSPRHAWHAHPRLNPKWEPDTPTDAKDRGSILHSMVLGTGSEFRVLDFKDFRTDRAKEARDKCREAGIIPVLTKHAAEYQEIAVAILDQIAAHPACEDFNGPGRSEVAAIAEIGPIYCRALFDRLPNKPGAPAFDLKSTGKDASPEAFARTIERDYYMNPAFYLMVAGQVMEHPPSGYRFIGFEVEPPYCLAVHEVSPELFEMGVQDMRKAVEIFTRCLILGEWPGYSTELHTVHPSAYRLTAAMMAEGEAAA